jgi:hypothetical protein
VACGAEAHDALRRRSELILSAESITVTGEAPHDPDRQQQRKRHRGRDPVGGCWELGLATERRHKRRRRLEFH